MPRPRKRVARIRNPSLVGSIGLNTDLVLIINQASAVVRSSFAFQVVGYRAFLADDEASGLAEVFDEAQGLEFGHFHYCPVKNPGKQG